MVEQQERKPLRVAGICGSIRKGSYTRLALAIALRGAEEAGAATGAFGAMHSLRDVGRALHAWVIPEQASVAQAWQEFDEQGRCKIAETEKRLKEVGRQVARFACLHTAERAAEFLREYESATENPGGEQP